jgi:hypothetical protein
MRAFVRILCVVLAVAIAVAGVLTVIEVIVAATGHDPVFVKWHGLVSDLASNQWKTAAPRVTAIILILVGLLLLFAGLRRGKPATVSMTTSAQGVDLTTTRRSLQRSLSATAVDVDGITDAKAKVKRRVLTVKAQAGSGVGRDDAQTRLAERLQQRLDELSLAERRRLKVKVRTTPDKGAPEAPTGVGGGTGYPTEESGNAETGNTAATVGAGTNRGETS